ncbi:MAG: SIS domain-containing protein [Carnobacterium sp.]|nr:SIS domain-containing protein [Carnobacterium sp.]
MDYLQQNLNNLIYMMDSIIRRDVDCSIDSMLKSERLFVTGSELSVRVQEHFSEKANKIGMYTQVISKKEKVVRINDLDVLICISKCGEERELIKMAESFKEEGAYVISITDRQSTLAKYSNRIINIDYKIERKKTDYKSEMLFNQSVYILLDSIVGSLSKRVPTTVI